MDADLAFLQSMQNEQSNVYGSNNDQSRTSQPPKSDEDDDYDPSSLMTENSSAQRASNGNAPSEQKTDSLSVPAIKSGDQSKSNSPSPMKQPRTKGGFVVDDDDDEDVPQGVRSGVSGAPGLLAVVRATSDTPQRSLSQTPSGAVPRPDVSIHSSVQDPSGVADPVPKTFAVQTDVAQKSGTSQSLPNKPSATPTPTTASMPSTLLPKSRLPNDRVGILEDRITEDPRGDIDAWLSLISEHRKRGKFDDARAVYDRFFKYFPTAVSTQQA